MTSHTDPLKSCLKPAIKQRQLIFKTPYQTIHQVSADFGEYNKEYFVNDYGTRVGLVIVQHDKVLLVRQYRFLIDRLSWEIPGGAVNEGESLTEAAERECLEETGIRCFNLQPLLFYNMALDTLNNPTQLFFCHEIASEAEPDRVFNQEVTGYEWLPLSYCLEMIFSQQIIDSFTIIGLLSYQALIGLETK